MSGYVPREGGATRRCTGHHRQQIAISTLASRAWSTSACNWKTWVRRISLTLRTNPSVSALPKRQTCHLELGVPYSASLATHVNHRAIIYALGIVFGNDMCSHNDTEQHSA